MILLNHKRLWLMVPTLSLWINSNGKPFKTITYGSSCVDQILIYYLLASYQKFIYFFINCKDAEFKLEKVISK